MGTSLKRRKKKLSRCRVILHRNQIHFLLTLRIHDKFTESAHWFWCQPTVPNALSQQQNWVDEIRRNEKYARRTTVWFISTFMVNILNNSCKTNDSYVRADLFKLQKICQLFGTLCLGKKIAGTENQSCQAWNFSFRETCIFSFRKLKKANQLPCCLEHAWHFRQKSIVLQESYSKLKISQ